MGLPWSNDRNNSNSALNSGDDKPKAKKKKIIISDDKPRNKFGAALSSVVVKEEQVWCSSSISHDEISSGGYLGGFSDLEEKQGYIHNLLSFIKIGECCGGVYQMKHQKHRHNNETR